MGNCLRKPTLKKKELSTKMAILFDLDDTLLDDSAAKQYYMPKLYKHFEVFIRFPETTFYEKWREAVPKYHKMYTEGYMTFEQQRRERIKEAFGNNDITDSTITNVVSAFDRYFRESWKPFSNTMEILDYFKSEKLGLVTNGSSNQQNEKIDTLGIRHYFQSIVISGDEGYAKPDKRIFLKACTLLNCQPPECFFVGDSWDIDVIGSNRCGMKSVWLNRYGKNVPEEIANFYMIKDLEELKRIAIGT